MNLPRAMEFCLETGSRIYEPRNDNDEAEVVTIGQNLSLKSFWIGISDQEVEGS